MTAVTGVAEAVVIPEDGVAYLKVDLHALDREALKRFSVQEDQVENRVADTVDEPGTVKQTN